MRVDAKLSPRAQELEEGLRQRVVGQPEAIEAVVRVYEVFLAGFSDHNRPIASLLFLGPTGVGKTRLVEAMGEALFDTQDAAVRIDCGEFQHSHEVAKLIGSPPGYLGHRETHPLITQDRLEQYWTDKIHLSLLLLDEIEKANDALWNLLLGILDKATLTLGDNRRVAFSHTVVFMTSNLGGREITELMAGGLGFVPVGERAARKELDHSVEHAAQHAARRKFTAEFLNRIDRVVVFRTLTPEELERVLDIELARVQQRILDSPTKFVVRVLPEARELLLREGTDPRYGARPMRRAIEKHVSAPLASLAASGQVSTGDTILVGASGSETFFEREAAA